MPEFHCAALGFVEVDLGSEGDPLLFAPYAILGRKGCYGVVDPPAQLDGAPELPGFEAGVGRFELGHFLA